MSRMLIAVAATVAVAVFHGHAQDRRQEWPVYGGDAGATRYSPLTDIHRGNVASLQVAWTWKPAERALPEFGTQPGTFQNTPLMIDDVLYVSTPYNRVVALEARTGRELWRYDPEPFKDGQPPNGTGFVHRGVAAWRDESGQLRIFLNSRYRLICLDARTGAVVPAFGVNGIVDLHRRSVVEGQSAALHEHVAADRFPQPRHPRQRRRRSPDLSQRSTGGCPRVRRAHREAGLGVSSHPSCRRVRQRDMGRRVVAIRRPHQRVGADVTRRVARAPLSPGQHAEQRLLRRAASGRESLRRVARVSGRRDGAAEVALPDRASRPVGLRPAGGADPDDDSRERARRSTPSCS